MAHTLTFDTLAYAEKLQAAGVTAKVAKVHAKALAEIIDEQLATKRDLKELEMRLTLRLGSIMVTGIAVVAGLVALIR